MFSCVLVFSFAFHAKIAAYYPPGHLDTTTASKLWLNFDQAELGTPLSDGGALWFVAWAALLVGSSSLLSRRYQEGRRRPVPTPLNLFNVRHHLRPPPRS